MILGRLTFFTFTFKKMKTRTVVRRTLFPAALCGYAILSCVVTARVYAQANTNPWPATGKVGIGTNIPTAQGPDDLLHIRGVDWTPVPDPAYNHPALRISLTPYTSSAPDPYGAAYHFGQLAMENNETYYSSIAQKFDMILRADLSAHDLILSTGYNGFDASNGLFDLTPGAIRFTTTPQGPPLPGGPDFERMTIMGNGNVGISTSNPSERLDVNGNIRLEGDDGGGRPGRSIFTSSPTQKLNLYSNGWYSNSRDWIEMFGGFDPSRLGELSLSGTYVTMFSGNDGTGNWGSGMEIALKIASNHNVGIGTNYSTGDESYSPSTRLEVNGGLAVGTNLGTTGFEEFRVIPASSTTTDDGKVVVGGWAHSGTLPTPTTTQGIKLLVNGTEVAYEYYANTTWSDDVFLPGYRLVPLDSVKEMIHEVGHLPGVPSDAEVKSHGVALASTESILLRKIEELTLYIIQLKEQDAALETRVSQLESK